MGVIEGHRGQQQTANERDRDVLKEQAPHGVAQLAAGERGEGVSVSLSAARRGEPVHVE